MDDYDVPFTAEAPLTHLYILTEPERAVVARALSLTARLCDAVDRHDDAELAAELRGRFEVSS